MNKADFSFLKVSPVGTIIMRLQVSCGLIVAVGFPKESINTQSKQEIRI